MNKGMWIASVGLMIGCAAGVVGKEVLVQSADAQVSGVAFRHRCVDLKWDEVLSGKELRPDLGKAGWELATLTSAVQGGTMRIFACFKREVGK